MLRRCNNPTRYQAQTAHARLGRMWWEGEGVDWGNVTMMMVIIMVMVLAMNPMIEPQRMEMAEVVPVVYADVLSIASYVLDAPIELLVELPEYDPAVL